MLCLRFRRKGLKIRSYLCRLPSAVNVMLNLSNEVVIQMPPTALHLAVASLARGRGWVFGFCSAMLGQTKSARFELNKQTFFNENLCWENPNLTRTFPRTNVWRHMSKIWASSDRRPWRRSCKQRLLWLRWRQYVAIAFHTFFSLLSGSKLFHFILFLRVKLSTKHSHGKKRNGNVFLFLF